MDAYCWSIWTGVEKNFVKLRISVAELTVNRLECLIVFVKCLFDGAWCVLGR